jgi:uncharacterized cupredoxin-like copper-binding protein
MLRHTCSMCRPYVLQKGIAMQRLLALLAAVIAAGGTALADQASASRTGATVQVRLVEFRVIPSTKTVRAGRVTFVVRNAGKLDHEFVVLRTNVSPGKLPVAGGRAKEIGRQGRIPTFRPGRTRRLTLTLRRGKYILLCNLSGHYRAGQFVAFRVR